ncbi:MAG: hypothetical protein IPO70_14935 [Bacteroidetes bacterium]|nr:hypothetical protein [Bacteroidota bacterium]
MTRIHLVLACRYFTSTCSGFKDNDNAASVISIPPSYEVLDAGNMPVVEFPLPEPIK